MILTPAVAAAIVDSLANPRHLLCAARAYPPEFAGGFELPGGKIDEDEEPLDTLACEIHRELGTRISIGPEVLTPEDEWWPIMQERHMGVWTVEVEQDAPEPAPRGLHSELRWVPLGEPVLLDWIGNDLLIALVVADRCARMRKIDWQHGPASHLFPPLPPELFCHSDSRTLPMPFPSSSRPKLPLASPDSTSPGSASPPT